MIPFVDLKVQFESIKIEIARELADVLEAQQFILGPKVKQFEKEFAKAHNIEFCLGCSNGTSAIRLALSALGVKQGDEVITTPHTFIATVEPIIELGAVPVFVDIKADTYCMDPDKIEEAITEKTKAIIAVHIYGQMCEMDRIQEIAQKYNLVLIEDAAQAHLSTYKGFYPGHYSDAATFSFYPGKNLGAYGDAGAVITKHKDVYEKMFVLRNHGRAPGSKYEHAHFGTNERMDDMQAGVLSVKLRYLQKWTEQRRKHAYLYSQTLKHVVVPAVHTDSSPVWHLYVIQTEDPALLAEHLKKEGIETGVHYPIPLHMQPALQWLGYKQGDFPVTEALSKHILSLPMFAELTDEQIRHVSTAVNRYCESQ
jgi:dTDP-4-amino-4,6-dideoxygalactose transaminase